MNVDVASKCGTNERRCGKKNVNINENVNVARKPKCEYGQKM